MENFAFSKLWIFDELFELSDESVGFAYIERTEISEERLVYEVLMAVMSLGRGYRLHYLCKRKMN